MAYKRVTPLREPRGAVDGALGGIGDMFSSLVSGVKNVTSSALTFYGNQKMQEGQNTALQAQVNAQQPQGGGLPDWVLPVGALAVGVGAVIYLKKRRK